MEKEITLKEAWEQILAYNPAIWFGLIGAIVVFIIEIILVKKKIIFGGFEKKIKGAQKEGRVLNGRRISCRYENRAPNDKTINRIYISYYEYELNGKKGKYQVVSTSIEPPYTIPLYYEKNSNKVFSNYGKKSNPLIVLIYIIPILVAYVIIKLLGGI